jgi:hypothetical protein
MVDQAASVDDALTTPGHSGRVTYDPHSGTYRPGQLPGYGRPYAAPVPVGPPKFCSPRGALGYTSTGKLMQCKPSATDTRNRWHEA